MVTITRLRPSDLQQVQAQTANNAALSDVITSLQFNKSTELAPLNTSCPTCVVAENPTGFVSVEINGNAYKVVCPTCLGYLHYHTVGGALPTPVNPFEAPLVVNRLLPADLKEAIAGFPGSATLDTMITSLQGNLGYPVAFACPLCVVDGSSTGWVTVQTKKVVCPLCAGYQKTFDEYQLTDGVPDRVAPDQPPPDPPLVQPLPPFG